jgi:phage terminase small subunit
MPTRKDSVRRALNAKQLQFLAEYLTPSDGSAPFNGTQAAIRAGYAEASAADAAWVLLKHPEIAARVAEVRQRSAQQVVDHAVLTTKLTLREMARITYFDPRRLVNADGTPKNLHELDDEAAAAIAGFDTTVRWVKGKKVVTTSYKLHNKVQALDQAAKITGEYAKDNAQRRPARELTDAELVERMNEIMAAAEDEAQAAIEKARESQP